VADDRAHLLKLRDGLLVEAVAADQRVVALQNNLAKEQADVAALREGVLGFLQSLAMTDEMSNEQREAAEAAARLREGMSARDTLYQQIAAIDARLTAHDPVQLAREEAAKKASAEIAAVTANRGRSEQLLELAVRIEAIDFELGPLTDALAAAQAATLAYIDVVHAVDEAKREPSGAPVLRERSARGMLGNAHAKALGFFTALDALPAPDDQSPRLVDTIGYEDRTSTVDEVLPRLLAAGAHTTRLDEVRAIIVGRIERLQGLLELVRTRHAEVAQRRLAFEHQRLRVQNS
jgi:hypothetical protein